VGNLLTELLSASQEGFCSMELVSLELLLCKFITSLGSHFIYVTWRSGCCIILCFV